jgi:ribokinase
MMVAFNPAPMSDAVKNYPLDAVDLLIVNEVEAEALTGKTDPEKALACLPGRRRLLTIGQGGVLYRQGDAKLHVPAPCVEVVDTTAAGDTFIGYFLAAQSRQLPLESALTLACRAAAACVTRPGAIPSIPRLTEIQ